MTPKIDMTATALKQSAFQDAAIPEDGASKSYIQQNDTGYVQSDPSRAGMRFVGHDGDYDVVVGNDGESDGKPSEWLSEIEKPVDKGRVQKKPLYYRFVKRAFDIGFSACVIAVGFLPGLILSAFIMKDTGGSPIYLSERVGRGGRLFKILKFRTMVADADELEKYFTAEQLDQWHREHKVDDDPRITKLGRYLRISSFDEFPQFINVFLGQLSIIGPRAITVEELSYFGDDQDLLLSCPMGITGLWQTGERNMATFESGIRQEIELMYVNNASLRLDAQIFFKTFKTMFERTGR